MTDIEQLRGVIEDLIAAVHLQTEELQRLRTHVEQQTARVPHASQLPLVLSELNELHHRVRNPTAGVAE